MRQKPNVGSHWVADPFEGRFWDRVQKSENCWEWIGPVMTVGYGSIAVDGKRTYSHRASYQLHYGPIPKGAYVLHHCDNRRCVRPDHLYLGDHAANTRDAMARNRFARGEKAGPSKLTETTVMEIRRRYATENVTMLALAREYGMTRSGISSVLSGKTWSHLPLWKQEEAGE